MIREDTFRIYRRPYAADLSSLRVTERAGHDGPYYECSIDAVWFRRRRSLTVACVGTLRALQDSEPADGAAFLAAHNDGRHGGACHGRWDGTRYWGAQEPDAIEKHLALLRPMLQNYPGLPDGYDGWWRF